MDMGILRLGLLSGPNIRIPEARAGVDIEPLALSRRMTQITFVSSVAMRPHLARTPVGRTAPLRTCLTVRPRRNKTSQSPGRTETCISAVRPGRESPKAPVTQAT